MRFRVAKAAIEFKGLNGQGAFAVLANHQTGIKEARVGDSVFFHALNRRTNDFIHGLGINVVGDDRGRRVGAHTTRVRTLVLVQEALVVLARCHREDVLAVNHHDEAGFFTFQEFFDHHASTGGAERVTFEHHVDGFVSFFKRHGNDHALTGC